jgi:hypothetical protein
VTEPIEPVTDHPAAKPGLTEEIKLVEDGWVWRCWACGSLGSGHYSEAAARREFDRHPCQPEPAAENTEAS